MSDGLRTEIIENQKARIDLIKWKLLIVAVIVAWSVNNAMKGILWLSSWGIGLIPFVCIFVDSHCFHINLRTLVIGHFLRLREGVEGYAEYEHFVHKLRLEDTSKAWVSWCQSGYKDRAKAAYKLLQFKPRFRS
jgi:hypothetical protein